MIDSMNVPATILAVEDEEVLLDLIKTLLESEGFKVLIARDGQEAVQKYQQHHDEIALVLSDMGIPVLSGWDAYQEMKDIDPNVKIILATGYQSDDMKRELLALGAKDFVSKPYVWEELVARIRQVIDEP
jgi:two-component system, cell cycle sensor histidine kinase and response regulator CckA